jgi:hypothetical protein
VRAVRRLAVVLALGCVLAGCGDPLADKLESSGRQAYSDDDPPLVDPEATTTTVGPDPADLVKWAFVADANRTCEVTNVAAARSLLDTATSPSDALDALSLLTEYMRSNAARLEAMTPPPGDEAAVADLIGGLNHILAQLDAVLSAGGFRSQEEYETWAATFRADGDAVTARFAAYGLTSCF